MRFRLGALEDAVAERLERVRRERVVERVYEKDPAVWVDDPDTPDLVDRLGWLHLADTMRAHVPALRTLADHAAGLERVVLCGMGGSSLAPEVLWRAFGPQPDRPRLHLLDSTHPAAVAAAAPNPSRSLFLIASKSGTTIETVSLQRFFQDRLRGDGTHFVAITDPDTSLARQGTANGYRAVLLNPPDVGGRFSALSLFGLVPAALCGVDPDHLLDRARALHTDDYVRLGVALGVAARSGRDKLRIVAEPPFDAVGLWIEQLVAESTGKDGTGIVPVVDSGGMRSSGPAEDRLTVRMAAAGGPSAVEADAAPRIEVELRDPYDLGGLFFGWELATAVAAHVLHVHPFNQPNVAESKANTARALETAAPPPTWATPDDLVAWGDGLRRPAYVAVMAYLPPSGDNDRRLRTLQQRLADRFDVAVTTGYAPRCLHSTGQLHKGGPPVGRFVQILDPDPPPLAIPGASYGFHDLIAAQAQGDYEALRARGRPLLRCRGWDLLAREFDA